MTLNCSIGTYYQERISPEPNSGCWLWTGSWFRNGYGRVSDKFKLCVSNLAHRNSLAFFTGNIPKDGEFVLHKCNNKSCVNPYHLYIGTRMDNARDAIRDGVLIQDGKGHKKLNSYIASQIKLMLLDGLKPNTIKLLLNLPTSTIVSDIKLGRTWNHS